MSIEEHESAANAALFAHLGVSATVAVPGELSRATTVVIERNAEVADNRGVVLERRCEIGLLVSEVGDGVRGTVIDLGDWDDCWILLEPIGNDGLESRWVAGKHHG